MHGVHDLADGLGVTLCEMSVAAGVGCVVEHVVDHAALFAESPGRVVLATSRPADVAALATAAGVGVRSLGRVGGDRLVIGQLVDLDVNEIASAFHRRVPDALGEVAVR